MPLPPNTIAFTRPMDPSDIADYAIVLSKGVDTSSFLAADEEVQSYSLTLTAEAVAAGITIKTGAGYATTLTNNRIRFWLEVSADQQSSSIFDGSGIVAALVLTIVTTASPARRKQRTLSVQVANQ